MNKLLRPSVVSVVLALVYALWVVVRAGDSLALVTLGERFAPVPLSGSLYSEEGYDGQFVYYLARYGLQDSVPFLDAPAYRAQRILLPAIGGLLALGQADWLPWTLLVVNLAALFAGTQALEHLLRRLRQPIWIAYGVALSLGMLGAVRLTATEPLAYALVIVAILLMERGHHVSGALLIGVSALAKETTLVFALAYGLWWLSQRQWQRALIGGLLMGLPFAVWQLILLATYGTLGIGSGGALATSFEIIPLAGFLRIASEGGLQVFAAYGLIIFLFAVLPALWALGRCLRDPQRDLWWWLLMVNALLMLFVPFSTYRELLGIFRFIIGLQIALVLYAAQRRLRRPLLYSTVWALTSLFVILSDMAQT